MAESAYNQTQKNILSYRNCDNIFNKAPEVHSDKNTNKTVDLKEAEREIELIKAKLSCTRKYDEKTLTFLNAVNQV
jgi:predicted patatin/cPLA2 family phospholipase